MADLELALMADLQVKNTTAANNLDALPTGAYRVYGSHPQNPANVNTILRVWEISGYTLQECSHATGVWRRQKTSGAFTAWNRLI